MVEALTGENHCPNRVIGQHVDVPLQQTCCGQPQYNSGDYENAGQIARQTIALLEPYDAIVIPQRATFEILDKVVLTQPLMSGYGPREARGALTETSPGVFASIHFALHGGCGGPAQALNYVGPGDAIRIDCR